MHDCGVKLVSGRDGGYILPLEIDPPRFSICIEIPDDPYHIAAFWGALDQLTWSKNWQRDEDHTAALVSRVWTRIIDAANERMNAGDRCQDETNCNIIPLQSERITWYPESPFSPGEDVPPGYIFHPWTVVTPGTLSEIIGSFGLGYRSGDVYTDLTKLPPGDWSEILDGNYLGLPYLRVNDLNGEGTVKVEFLNIPQGGRALLAVDGVVNIFTWQIAELNKDAIPPGETQTPFTVEVEVHGLGVHYVDVVILPTVDVSPIPVFFGGGFRSIQICGFGETAMTDPCCPDELDVLREIRDIIKAGFTIVPNLGMLPGDATAPCAPPGFDFGSSDDDVPEQIKRYNALCLTLERYVSKLILQMVVRLGMPSSYVSMALAIPGITYDNSFMFRAVWRYLTSVKIPTVKGWFEGGEYKELICVMLTYLQGKETTLSAFAAALEGWDTSTYSDTMKLLFDYAHANNQSLSVFEEFARELDVSYTLVSSTPEYECSCMGTGECDVSAFELVLDTDGTVTRIDEDTWEFTVPVYEITEADVQVFRPEIRDANWRCFNHISSTTAQSYYRIYNCAGGFIEGTGGGGGELVWHQMTIAFPGGSHVTAPFTFQITIQCPS